MSTGRVVVVLLVLAGLVFSGALPVRTYLRQRAQISALQEQVRQEQSGVAGLQASAAQWQDPTFVTEQARERLGLVAPGETGYIVTDSGSTSAATPAAAVSTAPVTVATPGALTPPRRVAVPSIGSVLRPTAAATTPATAGVTVTVGGADGLATLGAVTPWWSPGPTTAP